jgi:hypothetical protein
VKRKTGITGYQLQAGEGEPQVFYQLPAISSGWRGEPLVFTSYQLLAVEPQAFLSNQLPSVNEEPIVSASYEAKF